MKQNEDRFLKKGFNFACLNPGDTVQLKNDTKFQDGKVYTVTHCGADHCFIKFGPVSKRISNINDMIPVDVKALKESKLKLLLKKIIKEELQKINEDWYHVLKKGDKIKYIVPGTTNKIETGVILDKDSTRTEDFFIVLSDKTKKKINIFNKNIGGKITEELQKINESNNDLVFTIDSKRMLQYFDISVLSKRAKFNHNHEYVLSGDAAQAFVKWAERKDFIEGDDFTIINGKKNYNW